MDKLFSSDHSKKLIENKGIDFEHFGGSEGT